jgi:hypothetical protein
MMSRFQLTFGALILVQAAHSIEEYFGHLWESFPPTRFVTGLVSSNPQHGFVVLNVSTPSRECTINCRLTIRSTGPVSLVRWAS